MALDQLIVFYLTEAIVIASFWYFVIYYLGFKKFGITQSRKIVAWLITVILCGLLKFLSPERQLEEETSLHYFLTYFGPPLSALFALAFVKSMKTGNSAERIEIPKINDENK